MSNVRDTIFVSYSHARDGRAWCERVCDFLKFYAEERGLEIWADPYIEVGGKWRRQIGDRIDRTAVAVLLISQEFLLSEFIRDHELGPLLAAGDAVTVCPILVSAVTARGGHSQLAEILTRQWVRGPDNGQALARQAGERRQAALVEIADKIRTVMPTVVQAKVVAWSPNLGAAARTSAGSRPGQVWGAEPISEDYVPSPRTIASLRSALLSGEVKGVGIAGRAVGLQGMGGIGKTALARELIWDHELRSAFPDGLYWITFGQTPNLVALQTALLERLTGNRPGLATVEDGTRALSGELHEKRALLLLDDVWKEEHARAFAVLSDEGRYVLTSRDEGLVKGLHARLEPVGVFSPAKARAVLALASGQPQDELPASADEVAEECGYLALALVAAGSLARDHSPWEAIRDGLRDGKRIFGEHPYSDVFRCLGFSVDALEPAERERYLELAVFPEDVRIPEQTIARLWRQTGGLKPFQTSILLGRLKSRGLLTLDSSLSTTLGGRSATLHDLQHDYVSAVASNVDQLHGQLLKAHQRPDHRGVTSTPNSFIFASDEPYMWTWLTYHLARADRYEVLREILTSYSWLQAKLEVAGVNALATDFEPLAGDPVMRWIRGAIDLSAHVLAQDSTELPAQLLGRLSDSSNVEIGRLIESTSVGAQRLWLRPLRGSLTPPGGALRRSFAGHSGFVKAVVVLPDGRFVSDSEDKTLKLWDRGYSEALRTFAGESYYAGALAVLSDGRFVSASEDGTLKLWDPERSEAVRTFAGHSDRVSFLAALPDGRFLSASDDNTVKLWDVAESGAVRTFAGHSERIREVAVLPDGQFVSASFDHTLKLWDVEQGDAVRTFVGHSERVRTVAVLPDGRFVSASYDLTLKLWDRDRSDAVRTFDAHTELVSRLAVLPDGRFVSGSFDRTVKLWDVERSNAVRTFAGHTHFVFSVVALPDGRFVSGSFDNTLKLWDARRSEAVRTFAGHAGLVLAVALLPDGGIVSASDDRTLKLWDVEPGDPLRRFDGHSDSVVSLTGLPSGRFVSASADKTLKLWDVKQSDVVQTFTGHLDGIRTVVALPDGRFVSASADKTLKLWDRRQSDAVQTFAGHLESIHTVVALRNGRFVSLSDDNTLKLWDVAASQAVRTFTGHAGRVNAAAVLPDGRLVTASDDKTLKVWDVEEREAVGTFGGHSHRVRAVAVLPDGRFVSASGDKTLKLWDVKRSDAVRSFVGHLDDINAVAVLPDGRFVSASSDNTLKLWDPAEIDAVRTFAGHMEAVHNVVVLPDTRLVSSSCDGTLRVWDPDDVSALGSFSTEGGCPVLAIVEGRIIAGDARGCVHVLAIDG